MKGAIVLVTRDMEKTKVLKTFFALVLTSRTSLQKCQALKARAKKLGLTTMKGWLARSQNH